MPHPISPIELLRFQEFPFIRKISFLFMVLIFFASQNAVLAQNSLLDKNSNPNASVNATLTLTGNQNLCLVVGGVLGTYSAGGESGDVYDWTVTNAAGDILDYKSAGDLQTYKYLFTTVGQFNVSLSVRRGTDVGYYKDILPVTVQQGPTWVLLPDYLLCGSDPTNLTALDPNTPNLGSYSITWTDVDNTILGTGNVLNAQFPGRYLVKSVLMNPDGTSSCELNNSTFVGPAIDFQILKSSPELCEGKSVTLETDTPISGEWFISKVGSNSRTSFGTSYQISVSYAELSGPGDYYIIFVAEDPNHPNCPSERVIEIKLLEGPKISIVNEVKSDDCTSTNGSFDIQVNSDLELLSILETGFNQINIPAGTVVTIPDLKPRFYTITSTQNGCKSTQIVKLESSNTASITNEVDVTNTDETCSATGVIKGLATLTFNQNINNLTYRIYSYQSGDVEYHIIGGVTNEFNIELDPGRYLIEIDINGCIYPLEEVLISSQPEVSFSIPSDFAICESFELIPETTENLKFTLTYPDGNKQSVNSGAGFTLTEASTYSLFAEPIDPNSLLCPKTRTFTTTLSSQITYRPVMDIVGCFDPISYSAEIDGFTSDEVSIRWLNDQDDIVGRFPTFYPSDQGTYFLSVQPLKSGYCPGDPVEFEVIAPITTVPMDLAVGKICPDPGLATLILTTNENEVKFVKWIYYDPLNNREDLPLLNDLFIVEVSKEGSYEVVTYNDRNCEIGRTIQPVEKSALTSEPVLESSYAVCSLDNSIPAIDPGDFEKYEWFYKSALVSNAPTFKPDEVGDYTLVVTTLDDCQFTTNFTTFDVCSFQAVFPNAMYLSNPNKNFRVLTSQGVKEAELYIINRQGELIYHAVEDAVLAESPILNWDGRVNGKNSSIGTYSIVVILKNPEYGVEQKFTGSLVILD